MYVMSTVLCVLFRAQYYVEHSIMCHIKHIIMCVMLSTALSVMLSTALCVLCQLQCYV